MKVAVIGSRGLTVINDLGKFLPEGTTEIGGINHILRGYERIDEKLRNLGAHIERT